MLNMNLRSIFFTLSLFISSILCAQNLDLIPTINPVFFAYDQEIEVQYDVTGTYMENWSEAWLWTWLPENNGSEVPSNINPANSNSSATDVARFTKSTDAGSTFFTITMTPEDFFTNVTGEVTTIGFLIKGNDWGDGQSIDHLSEVGGGLRILVESPEGNFGFYQNGENIPISLITSMPADIDILVDNITIASAANSTTIMTDHTVINDGQVHTISFKAATMDEDVEVTYNYLVPPVVTQAPVPAGNRNGINYDTNGGTATLVLEAPNKSSVFVIGDFNNWQIDNDYFMNQDGERFWITLDLLDPNELYRFQYLIDGDLRIADPYAERISSPFDDGQIIDENRYPGLEVYPFNQTTEGVSFLQIIPSDEYQWTTTDFERPEKKDLIIYELLVRDFSDERTFNAVIEKLDYLQDLGINALELMPIMEFEGNISWGYNPAFMFAVDKFYGTENNLKKLIDEAHQRGIAVILDIVLNHAFGRCPLVRLDNDDTYGPPTDDNVYFNRTPRHDFNVGYDFNHESDYTKDYVDRVNEFWINEYRIDGFRFDLSKGFTQNNTLGNIGAWGQYDASRIALLKRMADKIWEVDPESYLILEHFAANDEEKELAEYGMMSWGNMVGAYRNAGKGQTSSIQGVYHVNRGWDVPHLIGYMESHDEERVMWEVTKNNFQSTKEALIRVKAAAPFFILVPGPKMLWQFQEFGYDEELNNDRLGIKPTRWEYLDDADRKKLHELYTSLINLRTKTDYIDEQYFSWSPGGTFKWINIDHPDLKIAVFGNLGQVETTGSVQWPATGTWYNYFTGEEVTVDALTDPNYFLREAEVKIFVSEPIENYVDGNPLEDFISSIDQLATTKEELTITPNPAKTNILINYPLEANQLIIYDSFGRFVEMKKIDSTGNAKFNVANYSSGIYIVVAKQSEQIIDSQLLFIE